MANEDSTKSDSGGCGCLILVLVAGLWYFAGDAVESRYHMWRLAGQWETSTSSKKIVLLLNHEFAWGQGWQKRYSLKTDSLFGEERIVSGECSFDGRDTGVMIQMVSEDAHGIKQRDSLQVELVADKLRVYGKKGSFIVLERTFN